MPCLVPCERFSCDILELSPYGLINLDECPILVLSCENFFTSEALDGCLELHKAYSVDHQRHYIGLIDPEG